MKYNGRPLRKLNTFLLVYFSALWRRLAHNSSNLCFTLHLFTQCKSSAFVGDVSKLTYKNAGLSIRKFSNFSLHMLFIPFTKLLPQKNVFPSLRQSGKKRKTIALLKDWICFYPPTKRFFFSPWISLMITKLHIYCVCSRLQLDNRYKIWLWYLTSNKCEW